MAPKLSIAPSNESGQGLVRTQFFFAPKNPRPRGNFFPELTENCHGFCKSDLIWQMADRLRKRIAKLDRRGADGLMQDPAVLALVDAGLAKLAAADANSFAELSRRTADGEVEAPLGRRAKENLLNFLISLKTVEAYRELIMRYGITDNAGLDDMQHPQVSFVLIFAGSDKAGAFRDASFNSPGDSFHRDSADQTIIEK